MIKIEQKKILYKAQEVIGDVVLRPVLRKTKKPETCKNFDRTV